MFISSYSKWAEVFRERESWEEVKLQYAFHFASNLYT